MTQSIGNPITPDPISDRFAEGSSKAFESNKGFAERVWEALYAGDNSLASYLSEKGTQASQYAKTHGRPFLQEVSKVATEILSAIGAAFITLGQSIESQLLPFCGAHPYVTGGVALWLGISAIYQVNKRVLFA